MNENLRRQVEDAKVEGWKLDSEQGEDKAVMKKPNYGSMGEHVLVALLTIWWTFGLGNVVWATYCYFKKSDKKVLRAEADEGSQAI